jgi:hypothetical protein
LQGAVEVTDQTAHDEVAAVIHEASNANAPNIDGGHRTTVTTSGGAGIAGAWTDKSIDLAVRSAKESMEQIV